MTVGRKDFSRPVPEIKTEECNPEVQKQKCNELIAMRDQYIDEWSKSNIVINLGDDLKQIAEEFRERLSEEFSEHWSLFLSDDLISHYVNINLSQQSTSNSNIQKAMLALNNAISRKNSLIKYLYQQFREQIESTQSIREENVLEIPDIMPEEDPNDFNINVVNAPFLFCHDFSDVIQIAILWNSENKSKFNANIIEERLNLYYNMIDNLHSKMRDNQIIVGPEQESSQYLLNNDVQTIETSILNSNEILDHELDNSSNTILFNYTNCLDVYLNGGQIEPDLPCYGIAINFDKTPSFDVDNALRALVCATILSYPGVNPSYIAGVSCEMSSIRVFLKLRVPYCLTQLCFCFFNAIFNFYKHQCRLIPIRCPNAGCKIDATTKFIEIMDFVYKSTVLETPIKIIDFCLSKPE